MGIKNSASIYQELLPSKNEYIKHCKTVRHSNPWRDEKNPNQKLTAKYWGPSVLRPARFPHIEAALICCICCWSCWAIRFCSLSFCVSANFTTMGEEQPCKQQFKQLHTCYPQQSQKHWIKTQSLEAVPSSSMHTYRHIYMHSNNTFHQRLKILFAFNSILYFGIFFTNEVSISNSENRTKQTQRSRSSFCEETRDCTCPSLSFLVPETP